MKRACVSSIIVLCLCGFAAATPDLYFTDANGNAISWLSAIAGEYVTIYIYGQTDTGNTYDYFNLGMAYDPVALTPKTGEAVQDLVMSTSTTFGAAFGQQETTYHGTSLFSAAASSMSGAPAGFGPTLLATAYFTFSGTATQLSMFNETYEYTYSTFFMDTSTSDTAWFSDTLTISTIPEPVLTSAVVMGIFWLSRKRRCA